MEGHPYYRVDTTRYRFDNATIRHYCGYPAGVAVLFTTDSRRIEARWTTAPRSYGWNMTPVLQRGMDLYVRENGVWTMAGAARPGLQDRHASTIVEHMDGQPKECMLYLPAWSELLTLEIGVDEGASVTPLESPYKHRVIVFGSSVTHGASASRPGMTYPARMSRMTGIEFEAASDEELLARIGSLKILSRARPLDKQRLVRLLQQCGEVVAVTGDGTNDAPALNFANVGLSMGSGTSVAKDASDITLLDDSFASIATAVMWGRSLYRNIQRFVLFQLTINFAAILICFVGAVFGTDMPLTVVQILWVNIIMDTFAAMAMASLPPNPEVMLEKPRPRNEFIITRAMARTLFTCGIIMVAVLLGMLFWWTITTGGLTVRQLTLFFSTFVFLQFWNMFNAKGFETRHSVFSCLRGCREFFLILLAIAVGQVLIVEFGGEVFRTEPLAWREWAVIIGSTSLIAVGGEIVRAIGRKR